MSHSWARIETICEQTSKSDTCLVGDLITALKTPKNVWYGTNRAMSAAAAAIGWLYILLTGLDIQLSIYPIYCT